MSSLVSLVIPAYNAGEYIEEAIESVFSQTYKNIELIVINDGSTDNTLRILKKYEEKYKGKFTLISRENRGQSFTLNQGWSLAQGSYIGYLSADDVLLPTSIEKSVQVLDSDQDVVLTYSSFNIIDNKSRFMKTVIPSDFVYEDVIARFSCPPGPGAFFRKKFFDMLGGWDSRFRQIPDLEYWIRLGTQGNFYRINEILAHWRTHDKSQSYMKTTVERANEPLLIVDHYFTLPISNKFYYLKNKMQSGAFLLSSYLHVRAGRFLLGSSLFLKGLLCDPVRVFSLLTWQNLLGSLFGRLLHKIKYSLKGEVK